MRDKQKLTQFLTAQLIRRRFSWMAPLCLLMTLYVPALASEETQKRVLVFYADRKEVPAQVIMDNVIQKVLSEGLGGRLDYYNEYIDVARFPEQNYQNAFLDFLRHKYQGQHFDLLIATTPACTDFLERYGLSLFPGTPVVFDGEEHPRRLPNSTGQSSTLDFKSTLELAIALQPRVKQVFIVAGASAYDKYYEDLAREQFRPFERRISLTYLHGLPLADLKKTVATLPPDSIIYYLMMAEDGAGNRFLPIAPLDQLSAVANVPIYGWLGTQLDHGIVGGSLRSVEKHSQQMAELALRVLRGERPDDIPITEVPGNVSMFDWRQLRRWGISESSLPSGSIVRFKEPSPWQVYKWEIVGAISLIVLQALGIVWLLFIQAKRRQAEEAQKNLAAIVQSSDDAILSKTLDGTITSWNAGAEKMYGYSASEIVGQHVSSLAPADLQKEVAGILEKIGRGESVDHLETMRITKDGRRIDVSLMVSPLKDQHRMIIGASTIARDITSRKKAEAEAVQQRAELAHLSRVTLLGELSGSLAHELNQPLTAILSNAQAAKRFLAHDNVDLDEVRDILSDIVDQDKRAGEVIHRLRLLFKKGEVEQQPLDVNNAVREVLKLIRGDLLNQRVTTLTKLAAALPTVKGDRVQLQQVLLNLVVNACDAMNGNAPPDRQIIVSTEADGADVRFSVSDSGSGLRAGDLEQVFEPFFSSKTNGLGLGLSVCRSIITAHGGKLWAINNPERGATFHFTLPVSREVSI